MDKVPGCSGANGPWARRDGCFPSDNPDQAFKLSGRRPRRRSSAFALGELTVDKKKGTATQVVTVPGTGSVELTGKDVARQVAAAGAAGEVALAIKPKAKLKRKLRKKGRGKAPVSVSFTPTGGTANAQDVAVKLKRKTSKKG